MAAADSAAVKGMSSAKKQAVCPDAKKEPRPTFQKETPVPAKEPKKKEDVIDRKAQLKEEGLSGGQRNKEPQDQTAEDTEDEDWEQALQDALRELEAEAEAKMLEAKAEAKVVQAKVEAPPTPAVVSAQGVISVDGQEITVQRINAMTEPELVRLSGRLEPVLKAAHEALLALRGNSCAAQPLAVAGLPAATAATAATAAASTAHAVKGRSKGGGLFSGHVLPRYARYAAAPVAAPPEPAQT